jgi:dynein heavy chain
MQVIFQRFAKDVEMVQGIYERGKRRPMLPRGAPPVAGHILWARQLLRRIEPPMAQCVALSLSYID